MHAGVPGSAGPAEAAGQFDGGYAYVIRASDNPVRPPGPARPPSFGRPADPARSQASRPAAETPADVYVYRDTSGQPDDPAAGGPGEGDAAYWYDLPGTGSGDDAPPRVAEETRGPFEPLVSSADPPGTTLRFSPSPDAASTGTAEPVVPPDEAPRAEGQEETAHAHARKLEQIKDLYLTAEAIGEANVDKHFDHLLAQQRELISDYFKHSNAARPAAAGSPAAGDPAAVADSADQAETDPGAARDPGSPIGGPAGAPGSARVAADQPRVW